MKWISVKDRLPTPGETVLTFPHFKVVPFGNSENEGLSYDWSDSDFWTFENDKVICVRPYPTYWMQLPPPPKTQGAD